MTQAGDVEVGTLIEDQRSENAHGRLISGANATVAALSGGDTTLTR